VLYVLTYHRVNEPDGDPDLDPRLLSATPREFDRQMTVLSESCRVVTPDDVLRALDGGRPLPERAVLVTFDDAYEDFETFAWPILRRRRVAATLFVPTGYPDRSEREFWWDRLHRAVRGADARAAVEVAGKRLPLTSAPRRAEAIRALSAHVSTLSPEAAAVEIDRVCSDLGSAPARGRVLGWESLRRLASEGLHVAPHSRSHALMSRMPVEEAVEEAAGALRDLEREIGPVPPCLAYPGGAWSPELPPRLARAGFRVAFTTRRGVNVLPPTDPLLLRRINVGRTTSEALLRAQLLPWMKAANRLIPLASPGSAAMTGPLGPERR
jgi:peptidoglycan/xylan/chitin deacetylase (PgdA/CDA1 family)